MSQTGSTTLASALDRYRHIFAPGDPSRPTLILAHGTGGSAQNFLEFGAMIAPDAPKLSIQGDVSEHGAARFFRRTGEGVYDMPDLARRTAALGEFLAAAMAEYAIDAARVIGVGYSNGANILANLAFERPALLNRIALMHPLIPFEPPQADLSGQKLLITAGRRDPICAPEATAALDGALRARGASVDLHWRPGGHEVDGGEIEALRRFAAE